jgi:AcrR family transcriptional regulator
VTSARELLLRDGYAATTVADIAEQAGVSPETVYKAFGGKAGLVRAVWAQALEGAGPEAAEERSDRLQASATDGLELIRGWMQLTVEVAPRVASVLLLVRDASAVDPDMARLWAETEDSRLRRMTRNAGALEARGQLRSGVTRREAGEVMWVYTSPDLFDRLVLTRRWSLRRYAGFLERALVTALLPDEPRGQSRTRAY